MHSSPYLFVAVLMTAGLSAQTTSYIAPNGSKTVQGNSNNTIPWWCGSATYQQVHDATDLQAVFASPVAIIKGLSFRNTGSAVQARTVDAQVTLGTTSVPAQSASTVFSTNLGASPIVVLPYTPINLPALANVSAPNPQGWFFMFGTPFIYTVTTGNLCWELRLKNSSSIVNSVFDASDGGNAIVRTLIGSGCTATGQTAAAAVGTRSLNLFGMTYSHQLLRGAASAPAALFLGDTAQHIVLPGFCSALETLPLVTLTGTTDGAGSWTIGFPTPNLYWSPAVTFYSQFAWLDAGLPNGVGVSNCSPIGIASNALTRIYVAPYQGGQGSENATSGSRESTYPFGLVTGFEQ